MANTISAIKRVRQTEQRTEVNRARKSRLRHAIRAMRRLIEAKNAGDCQKAMPGTFSAIDKAAKQGVIKKNTASRYKSRLTARVKTLAAA